MLLRFAEGYRSVISYVIAHGRIYAGRSFDAFTDLAGRNSQGPRHHAIGSVADDNLGMFGITEMAMKLPTRPRQRTASPELQTG
jgi:hypothetical protein